MSDIFSDLLNGSECSFNGKSYIRIGLAYPVGMLAVEKGSTYPASVVVIPIKVDTSGVVASEGRGE